MKAIARVIGPLTLAPGALAAWMKSTYRRAPVWVGVLATLGGSAIVASGMLGLLGLASNLAILWSTKLFAFGLLLVLPLLLFAPGQLLQGIGAADSRAPRSRAHFRWVLLLALLMLTLLVAVVMTRTMLLRSRPERIAPAATVEFPEAALSLHLAKAVNIETISHPETTAHESAQIAALRGYLASTYANVRKRLTWEEPGGNLLITWAGSDKTLKPLLLLAHMDVVPVIAAGSNTAAERGSGPPKLPSNPSDPPDTSGSGITSSHGGVRAWESRAFNSNPEQTKPFIYGRGTLDDKVSVIGILEAVERLVLDGFSPRRTLILVFGRDEEVGGKNGAVVLSGLLRDRGIRPECAIDEGSFIVEGVLPGFDRPIAPVGLAEKGYMDVELSVTAGGGHSSMPPPHTAIGTLARAISRLEDNPPPARFDGITRRTMRALGPEAPFLPRLVLVNDWLFDGLLLWALQKSPTTNALVRTTTAVTLVRGGTKDNVLPDSASAIVNLRLRPGDSSRYLLEHIKRVVDDPRVTVAIADPKRYSEVHEASSVSPDDTAAYAKLRTTIRQIFPGTVVVPFVVVAGTDARNYEGLTENVYRFLPLQLGKEDLGRIHGSNERITRRAFVDAVRFYYQLIRNFDAN